VAGRQLALSNSPTDALQRALDAAIITRLANSALTWSRRWIPSCTGALVLSRGRVAERWHGVVDRLRSSRRQQIALLSICCFGRLEDPLRLDGARRSGSRAARPPRHARIGRQHPLDLLSSVSPAEGFTGCCCETR